jgi:hypothetical protein
MDSFTLKAAVGLAPRKDSKQLKTSGKNVYVYFDSISLLYFSYCKNYGIVLS